MISWSGSSLRRWVSPAVISRFHETLKVPRDRMGTYAFDYAKDDKPVRVRHHSARHHLPPRSSRIAVRCGDPPG